MLINGAFWRTRTRVAVAEPARGVPELEDRRQPPPTLVERWKWARVLGELRRSCDVAEGKDWTVGADSTVVRAHQHAAGAGAFRPPSAAQGAGSNDNLSGLIGAEGPERRRWAGPAGD